MYFERASIESRRKNMLNVALDVRLVIELVPTTYVYCW
jgi:hypothetical protein